ncbi:MAG: ribbon-helix-helix domain-containing protein [Candidatus Bipolaricaulia bacterium]
MKTITVKVNDALAEQIERLQQEAHYSSKSEVIREAVRALVIEFQKQKLETNLQRYLEDEEALAEAADVVEGRIAATEEALKRAEHEAG